MTGLEFDLLSQEVGWWEGKLDGVREGGEIDLEGGRWSYAGVIRWVRGDEKRSVEYDKALGDYAHKVALECLPISDGEGDVQRDRLRIDTRMKLAGKWDRGRYGEKVEGGGGGGITVIIDKSCGNSVRIGLKDGAGNTAALEVGVGVSGTVLDSGTEPRFSGAEQEKDHA